MAGLDDHMPQYVSGHRTPEDAAAALAQLHQLDAAQQDTLETNVGKMMSLDLRRHGNDWATVSDCDCHEGHGVHNMGHKDSLPPGHGYPSEMVGLRAQNLHNKDWHVKNFSNQGNQD
jgi:hypothetical protein